MAGPGGMQYVLHISFDIMAVHTEQVQTALGPTAEEKGCFRSKAQACCCLAHGRHTWSPLQRLLQQSSDRAASSGEMQLSLNEVLMAAAPFPLLSRLSGGATVPRVKPDSAQFHLRLRVVIFSKISLFSLNSPHTCGRID